MGTKELQAIAKTLIDRTRFSAPMTRKQLLKAARKRNPTASKKDIVRGAFYAVIADADGDPEKGQVAPQLRDG